MKSEKAKEGPTTPQLSAHPREHQDIIVALEIFRVVLEAVATVVSLGAFVLLNHCAHSTVYNHDTLAKRLL